MTIRYTTCNKRRQTNYSIVCHVRIQLYRPTISFKDIVRIHRSNASFKYIVRSYHHHADSRPPIVVDADEDGYDKQVIMHVEILPIPKLVACPGLNNGQSHASPL